MQLNTSNSSGEQSHLELAWFRLPIDSELRDHFDALIHKIYVLIVIGFINNLILLLLILKRPDKKPLTSRALHLANYCIVNVIATLLGSICVLSRYTEQNLCSFKFEAIIFSIVLPWYYPGGFLLTLTQYTIIVKPFKSITIDPRKVKTTVLLLLIHWFADCLILVMVPNLVEDFLLYLKVMVMIIVSMSWIFTAGITFMGIRMVQELYKRNKVLHNTFNLSQTQQHTVTKQNTRLVKIILFYFLTIVIFSMPTNTAYLVILYCSECNHHLLARVCLYTMPAFLAIPVIHPIYWVVATPQYYMEFKRLIHKVFLSFCRRVSRGES